ncbi:MAG: lipocalin-like domain-containing protein [Nitrospiraceae bacterium]
MPLVRLALVAASVALLSHEAAQAADTAGFEPARPGYQMVFPRDHGAHPAFQTEWWYYTGHLQTDDGRPFGYQLTFFRRGLHRHDTISTAPADAPPRSAWRVDDLYFAHLALTDIDGKQFHFTDRISREGLGKAGADVGRLHVWLDRWQTSTDEHATDARAPHHLVADGPDFSLTLTATPTKPPTIHGTDGVSRKGPDADQASHYYSLTRMDTVGSITTGDRRLSVRGVSWMDHEFGSGALHPSIVGWDWFSLHLATGEEVMVYRLRLNDGSPAPASSATWIRRDGSTEHLPVEAVSIDVLDWWTSPHSQARYPSRWRVRVPSHQLELTVTPQLADQELRTTRSTQVTYWEGAVRAEGTIGSDRRRIHGDGYVELTGYAERYRPRL